MAGDGVYAETSDRVDAGTIDVGRITYGMIDPKVATRADIRQTSTGGSVSVTLSGDEGMTEELGTQVFGGSVNPTVSFDALEIAASVFSYKVTLYPAAGDATDSPVIRQIQLRVWPAPNRGYTFSLPLVLSETNERHPSDDYDFLTSKVNEKHTVLVQVGEKIRNVVMEDYSWMPVNQTSDGRWQNGTLVAKCKVMAV